MPGSMGDFYSDAANKLIVSDSDADAARRRR